MKKLSLLILCLLVTCKVFTQSDTLQVNKYVFLTESQAKRNIKELVAYDALKLISLEQENRIGNLKMQTSIFDEVIEKKDSIIKKKDNIIELKDKIINAKKPIEFHTYVGAETFNFSFTAFSFYGRASLEIKKINLGIKMNYTPTPIYDLPNIYYNLIVEYKIF